jgi:hypothetical protein
MLVTTREHQRTQCSLLVQQALGRLDHARHTSTTTTSTMPPTAPPEPELDTELVAGTVQRAFNR